MPGVDAIDEKILSIIHQLIDMTGGAKTPFEADLITQQIQTSLRLLSEGHNTGQLKLITRAMKEMRYAYRIFNEYPDVHCISIFGSARTPEDHLDYKMAEEFSRSLAQHGWMCITGAADGIMKAGMAGTAINGSFGLSIRLPFEVPSNRFLEGDPKLIHFRYFFTRKLMFMSHSEAIAAFPGGFGTLDELFEMLTLMQTGKSKILPIVLMEAAGGTYWDHWEKYVRKNLLEGGRISPEDMSFFYISPSIEKSVEHITNFYKRYHSNRYVKDELVLRLKSPISKENLKTLNQKFSRLFKSGCIRISEALAGEEEYPELQRLVFHHTRKDFGLLRQMIDEINAF
jgi:uncharacterized protein (TIGR00730 family)